MLQQPPFVSLSLWRYTQLPAKWWAFTQMGLAPRKLAKAPGLHFGRLMGSGGGNGFSLRPNWGVYAYLGVWEDEAAARTFWAEHEWPQQAASKASEQLHFWLRPVTSHGAWGGSNPFTRNGALGDYDPQLPTAVLTRATIRTRKLPDFWRYVPQTSASVYDHPDRLLSLGVGEYPLFMQATFSLWRSGRAMQDFAYRSEHHKQVVQLTRERNWYKEEMFTRFQLIGQEGSWGNLKTLPADSEQGL
ncbi:MAG: hypothetical protein AAF433_09705 [Bacteroidota bacterium]